MLLMDGGFTSTLELLQHIDDIERLGLGYRFRNHIRRVLTSIYGINNGTAGGLEDSTLHEASLRFRILRQHGHNNVSQDFLRRFSDSLIGRVHETDVKGMVSLYEASHLAFMEESDLHEAKLFATEHLGKLRTKLQGEEYEDIINHALETPLYHAMLRLEARHYIDRYTKQQHANPLLLELATLDFNMLQAEFKKELKKVSTWWKSIGLAHKLGFARDRLVECFFWTVGMVFEPQYHSCRVGLTKVGTLITVIDDIYDVYGCLDELEVFTNAVRRWDINAMEHMPKCLQVAFEALHNTVTDMGSNTLIGQDITPILTKVWGELLETFLVEAKWTRDKYIPRFQEYIDKAWLSVSGVVILTHGYFLINHEINKDHVVESLEKYYDLMKWSSMIFRLYNDLATSSDEIERSGKSINAITCYMHENGVCEEVARAYIKALIDEAWRKLIKAHVDCSKEYLATDPFIDMPVNLARISCCTYQHGDGHGAPDARARDRVSSVIIEPITIKQ
ncbi:hypothetical protein E3N88_24139 [Mikania micrantha]|uniref:Uncharacterized protein n=1 Tax=Mikania micrantha TaxID=192012 RepID=A0A5N6NHY7_9ASTR|nr:hypothetical protein E3N88_24139 [Mikania micrantha]